VSYRISQLLRYGVTYRVVGLRSLPVMAGDGSCSHLRDQTEWVVANFDAATGRRLFCLLSC